MEHLYRYLTGYLIVRLVGTETERFLNLCANRGIVLWKLVCMDGTYYAQVALADYKKMHPAVRKTGVRPIIVSKRGLPFFLYRNRKRGLCAAGFLLFFVIIFRLSFYIWDISVEGSYYHTPQQLIRFLQEQEICAGRRKSEIDCPEIEAMIRKNYPDIGWVSAEIKGTRLIIRISETNMPETDPVAEGARHIVAKHDGIVRELIVRSGTPAVSRGDVVRQGDILISGVVEMIGDGDLVVGKEAVSADGDVVLATYYKYEDRLKREHTEKIYTGEAVKGFGLYSGENSLFAYLPSFSYEKYDAAVLDHTITLFENLVLPLRIRTVTLTEYYEQRMTYSEEAVTELLNQRLGRYLEELEADGVKIIENQVEVTVGTISAAAQGKIIVEETAVEYRAVEEEEYRTEEEEAPEDESGMQE